MTKDTALKLAREAGLRRFGPLNIDPELEQFAELVRADEREACAKVCDELHPGLATRVAAEHIRARGNT